MLARESRLRESCDGWKTWDVRHSIRDLRSYDLTTFHTLSLWLEIQQSKSLFSMSEATRGCHGSLSSKDLPDATHRAPVFWCTWAARGGRPSIYICIYQANSTSSCSSPLKTSRRSPSTRTSTGCTVSIGTALHRQAQSPAFAMSDLIFRLGGKCKLVSWWRSGLGSSYGLAYGLHCRCWMLVSGGK